ncbi:MAG: major capsid protein P2 [Candidatus Thiodiazotropha taylori]
MKATKVMPAFNGVAANSTATLNIPIGWTYHGLMLSLGGTFTEQHIDEMRLMGNGKPIMTMSGDQLDIMNQFNGLAISDGSLLRLPFERHGLKTRDGVEFTAIGTGMPLNVDPKDPAFNPTPLSTLQLEVDIGAATNPTLSAKAIQSGKSPLGTLLKRRKFTFNPSGAGYFDIADLPKGDVIDKIWIFSDQLNGVILERNNFRVFERTAAENSMIQTDGVRVPQTNLFVIDPSETGNGGEWIQSNVDDFRLKLDMAAGDTVTVFVDYLGGLLGN